MGAVNQVGDMVGIYLAGDELRDPLSLYVAALHERSHLFAPAFRWHESTEEGIADADAIAELEPDLGLPLAQEIMGLIRFGGLSEHKALLGKLVPFLEASSMESHRFVAARLREWLDGELAGRLPAEFRVRVERLNQKIGILEAQQ